jgi:hypothetical protein
MRRSWKEQKRMPVSKNMLRHPGVPFIVATAVCWTATFSGGCTPAAKPPAPAAKPPVRFVSKLVPIEFTFPAGWYRNSEQNPFDLHCFSPRENMLTGIYAYKKSRLVNPSPHAILEEQIDEVRSKRQNFVEREAIQTLQLTDKSITTVTFVGEKGSARNWYRFALIEFKPDADGFAVALQIATDGSFEEAKPIFAAITESARLVSEDK